MKNRNVLSTLLLAAVIAAAHPCRAESYYKRLFERGVFMMEVQANCEGAIPIFQEIVKRHPNDRHYAALAQFYLGLCYKRLGSGLALPTLQDVIHNFSDQKKVVRIAEFELLSLEKPKATTHFAQGKILPALIWRGRSVLGAKSLSPDGRFISYIDLETGNLNLYDLTKRKTLQLSENTRIDSHANYAENGTISPDSSQIAYSRHSPKGVSEMWIHDIDGSMEILLFQMENQQDIHPLGWTHDGRRILARFAGPDFKTQICFVSATDGSIQLVKDMGTTWPFQMNLSPDGLYIAYCLSQTDNSPDRDIYLFGIKDKKEIPLVVQPGDNSLLGWSADSKNILFTQTEAGRVSAWALSIWEGQPRHSARQIRSDIGSINSLGLSPQGALIFEKPENDRGLPVEYTDENEIWIWEEFFTEKSRVLTVPDEYATIQAAVSAADTGDTVYIRSGEYTENLILGKSLTLQGEDRKSTIIDGAGEESVIQVAASNIHINGLTVQNGKNGIDLITDQPFHHVTLKDLIITRNHNFGILSRNSGGFHLIENCIFSHGGGYAINAHQFSHSVIRNCEVFENGAGFRVGWGWYIQIIGNFVHHNRGDGIVPDSCYYSTVEKNLIYANKRAGIKLGYISSRNTIRKNIIANHQSGFQVGLEWGGYSENRFYHNDVIDNQVQVEEASPGLAGFQHWDDGYPSGGNFWSDYSGQNEDKDIVGDTPHPLLEGAKDNFPLMAPHNKIQADLAIHPSELFAENRNGTVTAMINLPAQIPVKDIKISSLRLNDTVLPEKKQISIEDTDGDGVPDLKMVFSWKKVARILQDGQDAEIRITGQLRNGILFVGSYLMQVADR